MSPPFMPNQNTAPDCVSKDHHTRQDPTSPIGRGDYDPACRFDPRVIADGRHATAKFCCGDTCFLIDECVAVDAGSIALALNTEQRQKVRDIIVTHPHMDHIASLPIFIDDLFETLGTPVRVYATPEVIDLLERDIFNWNVYPRFSELKNEFGPVMEYVPIPKGEQNLRSLT